MVENGLIERIVERAVAARLQPLEHQVQVLHWLATELVRQLPRHALLDAAHCLNEVRRAHPQKAALMDEWAGWHQYLLQLGALVEGDTPPALPPGLQVPARRPRPD